MYPAITIFFLGFCTEQATVQAKQYIRTNVSNIRDETQGIEFEFVCRESQNDSQQNIVSSPIRYLNGIATSTSVAPTHRESNDADNLLRGFDFMETDAAIRLHRTFSETFSKYIEKESMASKDLIQYNLIQCNNTKKSVEKTSSNILANVFISDACRRSGFQTFEIKLLTIVMKK